MCVCVYLCIYVCTWISVSQGSLNTNKTRTYVRTSDVFTQHDTYLEGRIFSQSDSVQFRFCFISGKIGKCGRKEKDHTASKATIKTIDYHKRKTVRLLQESLQRKGHKIALSALSKI